MADVMVKIVFKFVSFGVLVVDFGAMDGGFVSAAFVRHNDIFFVGEIGDKISCEGEHGAEGGMAVQEAFAVEADDFGVEGAFRGNGGIATSLDASEISLLWVEGEASTRLSVGTGRCAGFGRFGVAEIAQELEADAGIFAATDGD